MLNRIVLRKDFRADGSNFLAQRMTDHLAQPIIRNNSEPVINESNQTTICFSNTQIIHCGQVERIITGKHFDTRVLLRTIEIIQSLRVRTLASNSDDFAWYMISSLENALNQRPERFNATPGGNDQTHQRRGIGNRIDGAMKDEVTSDHIDRFPSSLKVRADRSARILVRVVFRRDVEADRSWQFAPVIQHMRNMSDVFFRN